GGGALAGIAALPGFPALPGLGRRAPYVSIDDSLKVGVVGIGRRASDLLARLGHKLPTANVHKSEEFQPIVGVEVAAVCDTFRPNREWAARAVAVVGPEPAAYADYRELLAREDLDALIVATPDFSHAPIAIAAVERGLDVYVEKCLANTPEQLRALEAAASAKDRIVQTGYQLRQDEIRKAAAEIVRRGYLGEVRLIRFALNRHGAVGRLAHPLLAGGAAPDSEFVDWELFLAGVAPERPYDPKRYFEWRLYWDYANGVFGDQLTHVADEVAVVAGLGLPSSATASGGVYEWRDGRETPDTITAVLEYDEPGTSLVFSNVNSNSHGQDGTTFYGTEGTLEVSWQLRLFPDRFSAKYAEQVEAGKLDPETPMLELLDPAAATALQGKPTELWLAGRGATRTTRPDGEFDVTRLHLDDFFDAVRTRREPAAGIAT
ncbi:MAG TPA: Gfo/Idh/MocA family oxidoreductase, partial [Planctomycetota bacterium]|nr:Gfo/Idh/MocA family oxidoreductase [Planctomycetota bacterium]